MKIDSDIRIVVAEYVAVFVILGALIVNAPLPVLLDRFMPDDAFYYMKPALNLATTGFSSFDGLHFTNGYHPLWFLMNVPVFWLFPDGGEVPIRVLLVIQLALAIVATGVLTYSLARLFDPLSAGIAGIIWIIAGQRVLLNGLETSILMLVYGLVFCQVARIHQQARNSYRAYGLLGVLSGLTFLARTDMAFLCIGLFLSLLAKKEMIGDRQDRMTLLRKALVFAAPLGAIAGAYLAVNLLTTGHLVQVSGAAKLYHSTVARDRAIANSGSALTVRLDNLLWATESPGHRYIVIGVVGPWLLILLSLLPALKESFLPKLRPFWPFFFAATISYLYYGFFYYGTLSQALWYYNPHAFLACFVVSALAHAMHKTPLTRRIQGIGAWLLTGWVLNWLSVIQVLLAAAVSLLLIRAIDALLPRISESRAARVLGAILPVAGGLVIFGLLGPSLQTWRIATLVALPMAAILLDDGSPRQLHSVSAVTAVVVFTTAVHMTNLSHDVTSPPAAWNYHLYRGALWARENLPEDATLWSDSAGILGYFSERTSVNTDGLANSYEFLDGYLAVGRSLEYLTQWDYTIDAWEYPFSKKKQTFPDGCVVPLPMETGLTPFSDGDILRRLAVYQMQDTGIVECGQFVEGQADRHLSGQNNIIRNGDFVLAISDWGTWGEVQYEIVDETLSMYKDAGGESAVVLQETGHPAQEGDSFEIQLDLGNEGPTDKQARVFLHDAAWQNWQNCEFEVPGDTDLQTHVMNLTVQQDWPSVALSIYVEPADGRPGLLVDNVSVTPYRTSEGHDEVICR